MTAYILNKPNCEFTINHKKKHPYSFKIISKSYDKEWIKEWKKDFLFKMKFFTFKNHLPCLTSTNKPFIIYSFESYFKFKTESEAILFKLLYLDAFLEHHSTKTWYLPK